MSKRSWTLPTIIWFICLGILLASRGFCQEEPKSPITVQDAVICQEVVDRTPVGTGDVFTKDVEKLFCFTRVVGAIPPSQVTHNWYYKGALQASVVLPVGSGNWRTWSSKTMRSDQVGEWMVEILSDQGVPLESIIFFVQ